jgi:hypothetical protein
VVEVAVDAAVSWTQSKLAEAAIQVAVADVVVFWMRSKLDEVAVVVAGFWMQSKAVGVVAPPLMVGEEDYWRLYRLVEAVVTETSVNHGRSFYQYDRYDVTLFNLYDISQLRVGWQTNELPQHGVAVADPTCTQSTFLGFRSLSN